METVVTFRLEDDLVAVLDEKLAKAANADSRHKYARQILADHLLSNGDGLSLHEIAELRAEITRLREDLATIAVALLTQAGKIDDPKRARAWAKKVLLSS